MRVAVIGSGLAGLTTAYLLRKEGVEVWLVEKSDKLGFHSHSVEVDGPAGNRDDVDDGSIRGHGRDRWIVDVPMRGFQGGYYPLLLSLYRHISLPVVSADYTFSFSSPRSTYFIHSGSSGVSIPSLPSAAWSSPFALVHHVLTFLGVALCYLLLLVLSFMAWHDLLPSALSSPELTLRGFTTHLSAFLSCPITIPVIRYSPWTPLGETFEFFIAQIVLPLFSSVGTMTSKDVWELPVRVILEYVHKTLGTSHYHLARGYSAADVARLLSESVRVQGEGHVRLSTEIMGLEHDDDGGLKLALGRKGETAECEDLLVDKVVLATQASVAHRLLKGFEKDLRQAGLEKERRQVDRMKQALGAVRYRETIVVTHRDASVLPEKANQRDINFLLPTTSSLNNPSFASVASKGTKNDTINSAVPHFSVKTDNCTIYTMATQIIHHPNGKGKGKAVLQTTNPVVPINPQAVLSVSRLERALPLRRPREVLSALRPTSSRIYIAGSYAYPGIPLLEGCVGSAKLAVEAILREQRDGNDGGNDSSIELRTGGVDWKYGRGGWAERVWNWRRKQGIWS